MFPKLKVYLKVSRFESLEDNATNVMTVLKGLS